jgi:hypothetical protein
MEESFSWEADSRSDGQEIPCHVCNPKVDYSNHKASATGLYPEPFESTPCPRTSCSKINA